MMNTDQLEAVMGDQALAGDREAAVNPLFQQF